MNFWQKMKDSGQPILCLAPMADVTDAAFRYIIAKYSKDQELLNILASVPCVGRLGRAEEFSSKKISVLSEQDTFNSFNNYVTYTEFVSADGLVLAPEAGRKKLLKNLEYSEIERPIVAQFFTSNPDHMYKVAKLAMEFGPARTDGNRGGFDGIDINMGCPDKSIEKQNAGASLIKNPKLARELIRAAKDGVQNKIPVSVKTRLGYNKDELEEWLPELLAENPAAIIIHARTRKEMSKAPAKWERIKRAVEIRDQIQNYTSKLAPTTDFEKTPIIGNGDVKNVADAIQKCKESGADGAMLGRAVFGTPWLLSNSYEWFNRKSDPEVIRKILEILVEHTKLFEEKFGSPVNGKSFAIMKKHFKEYLREPNVRDLKYKLMRTENASQVEKIVRDFLI